MISVKEKELRSFLNWKVPGHYKDFDSDTGILTITNLENYPTHISLPNNQVLIIPNIPGLYLRRQKHIKLERDAEGNFLIPDNLVRDTNLAKNP